MLLTWRRCDLKIFRVQRGFSFRVVQVAGASNGDTRRRPCFVLSYVCVSCIDVLTIAFLSDTQQALA